MASNAMTWPRERRSGSIETKSGAAPGKDLHGGEPGARGAAPSTPARAPSRPGPRTGRFRARRLSLLLPALALLVGALGPFAPAQAEVHTVTVWSATLTPKSTLAGLFAGCDDAESGKECSSTAVLSDNDFTLDGTVYTITVLGFSDSLDELAVNLFQKIPQALRESGELVVGDTVVSMATALDSTAGANRSRQAGDTVTTAGVLTLNTPVTVSIRIVRQGPAPNVPRRLTPDPDLLTGLTINDGTRDLRIESNVANTVGFGGTYPIYTVQVAPGVRSVTVTPTWTNSSIIQVSADLIHVTYGIDSTALGVVWTSGESGTGKAVSLMPTRFPNGNGTTEVNFDIVGAGGGTYRFFIQHNTAWESANERLRQLELEIGQ